MAKLPKIKIKSKSQYSVKQLHRWLLTIKEVVPLVNILHCESQTYNVQEFYNMVQHLIENNGEDETIRLLKLYKLHIQQICLNQEVTPIPFCKTDRKGYPKVLKPWFVHVDSPVERKRHIMSLWRVTEMFKQKPKYQVNSIINKPYQDENLIKDICSFMDTWKPLMKINKSLLGNLVMSKKAGPNGPASISCLEDSGPLLADEPLATAVQSLLDISLPGMRITDYAVRNGKQHSKLVLLSDKSCKTRVIAIADWWSNSALSGIHINFMKFLKTLKADVAYRQDEIPKLIKGLGTNLYSADMTAFTDVFPVQLEQHMIKVAYGDTVSVLWRNIVSNRVFKHPFGDVKYAAGNPMGLLSSWPVSTATHHAVKQYCASLTGKSKGYKYLMLGDDSLDTDKSVHFVYRDVMSRLGVSTSLSKCTQSEQSYAEFAKRLFTPEGEITGLPVTLISELSKKPEQFIELVRIARERGYSDSVFAPAVSFLLTNHKSEKLVSDILSLPESVSGIPPLLEVKPDSWAKSLEDLIPGEIEHLLRMARDKVFWEEAKGLNKPVATPTAARYRAVIDENHPIIQKLSSKAMRYLQIEGDGGEFSIYEEWLKGNYREMANVPNINDYRYNSKGHKVTKAKYLVYKNLLAFASGNMNINLYQPTKLSNFELFQRSFPPFD